jgi:DNA-binding CsgD family transcriptional regulator
MLLTLLPRLTLATTLLDQLQTAKHGYQQLARVFERLKFGVILTDETARPLYANARAIRIMAEARGLTLNDARLAAATPAATQRLRAAILAVSSDAAIESRRLRLPQALPRLPLLLAVVALAGIDAVASQDGSPRVAVLVTEPDVAPVLDRLAVAETFQLTPRETEVAIRLSGGASLQEVAAELALGLGTVRHHLKHVFDKTGAHSQASLVALLHSFDLIA